MTINQGGGRELTVNEETDKTYPEVEEQIKEAYKLISKFVKPEHQAEVWVRMTFELLHWMYTNPGEHPSPVDLLRRDLSISPVEQTIEWPSIPKGDKKTND